jgi:hypothetical protein
MPIIEAIRRFVCSIWSWFFGMSEKPKDDLLSQDHLSRFGSIVSSFAHLEYLMQTVMAGVAGLDANKVTVLTKVLTYSQKRDTLYSYLKFYTVPEVHEAQIKSFFDGAHKHNALRNHIAHSMWTEGTRHGTIKPTFLDLRQGKALVGGQDEKERDYTMNELGDAANELRNIVSNLVRYIRATGTRE